MPVELGAERAEGVGAVGDQACATAGEDPEVGEGLVAGVKRSAALVGADDGGIGAAFAEMVVRVGRGLPGQRCSAPADRDRGGSRRPGRAAQFAGWPGAMSWVSLNVSTGCGCP